MRRSCVPPPLYRHKLLHTHTHTYKDMHSPPLPLSLAFVALNRQPDKLVCDQRRKNGCGTGWLLAGAGLLPLLQSRVSMVYVLLLLLRCFSCSHTVLPKEHSLGVIFFLLTLLMLCCIFLKFPVFLFCLPPCHICMLCMYGQVDG